MRSSDPTTLGCADHPDGNFTCRHCAPVRRRDEKAPDAAATAVERIDPTHEGEITMHTTAPAPIHPGIDQLFDELNSLPEGHFLRVEPGDFGYVDRGDEWTRPIADLRIDLESMRGDLADRQPHWFGRWYRPDGTLIPLEERSAAWETTEIPDPVPASAREPMAITRTAHDLLFISDGVWYPVAETQVDGQPAFVFRTSKRCMQDDLAEARAQERAFLEENAATINVVRPGWATDVEPILDSVEPTLRFEAQFGTVEAVKYVYLQSGEIVDEGDDQMIYVIDESGMTAATARTVAADLLRAAAAVEGAAL